MRMNNSEYIERAEQVLLHTYNRFPVVLEKGRGVWLEDVEGKKYLDFGAGIAVCALGYGDEEYQKALESQISKILHISNLYYSIPLTESAEKLV